MSRATYLWPDPSKPDGLPYIRHDGQTNPENRKITDHEEFGRTCEARARSGPGLVFHRQRGLRQPRRAAAAHLVSRSRDKNEPQPRIRPGHLGVNTGRGIGIIDTRPLVDAIDAVGLLAGSTAWTAADDKGLHDWFAQYLHWMRTSKNGHG